MYIQQIDDHISKGYTEEERKEKQQKERKL